MQFTGQVMWNTKERLWGTSKSFSKCSYNSQVRTTSFIHTIGISLAGYGHINTSTFQPRCHHIKQHFRQRRGQSCHRVCCWSGGNCARDFFVFSGKLDILVSYRTMAENIVVRDILSDPYFSVHSQRNSGENGRSLSESVYPLSLA